MKKQKLFKILGGGVLFLLSVSFLFSFTQEIEKSQPKDEKGLIKYSDGRVRKKEINEENWKPAEKNTAVLSGDRVRTYQRSRAELELLKLDIIRMAPETIIDVVKLYEETKSQKKETQIQLNQGDIWAKIKKKDNDSKFNISAPVAMAAITGTVLRMNVNTDSSTQLKVYNGEVRITNAPERTDLTPQSISNVYEVPGPQEVPGPREVSLEEWVYIVKNMQTIIIDKDGQIKEVGKFDMQDKDEQTDWVKWNLERDRLK